MYIFFTSIYSSVKQEVRAVLEEVVVVLSNKPSMISSREAKAVRFKNEDLDDFQSPSTANGATKNLKRNTNNSD